MQTMWKTSSAEQVHEHVTRDSLMLVVRCCSFFCSLSSFHRRIASSSWIDKTKKKIMVKTICGVCAFVDAHTHTHTSSCCNFAYSDKKVKEKIIANTTTKDWTRDMNLWEIARRIAIFVRVSQDRFSQTRNTVVALQLRYIFGVVINFLCWPTAMRVIQRKRQHAAGWQFKLLLC